MDEHEAAEVFARQFPAVYLRFHRRDAKGTALTPASRSVLQHLALAGPVTVGELCHHLERTQSVVSDIVAHLEQDGLIDRHDDPADRRRRLVWLSPSGHELLARDRDVLSVELLERAFAELSDDERRALLEAVDSLLRADDAASAPPPRLPTHPPHSLRRKESS
ncbi:MAG TPA: MarR family winged helix-turn-helix transcriptional regulator [Acidimicrobiales bacterium]|nr:MarR family winged helix-turn-helix transcriptional regulator [Acidimicrobiales bacterium]